MWYTYILKCSDNTLYTGVTNDLNRRIRVHNDGKGAKYTRSRRPVELIYQERFPSKSQALIREFEIKNYSKAEKLTLIKNQL